MYIEGALMSKSRNIALSLFYMVDDTTIISVDRQSLFISSHKITK